MYRIAPTWGHQYLRPITTKSGQKEYRNRKDKLPKKQARRDEQYATGDKEKL